MLKSPCMFEDGCLFYTLANFYREQSNLKGIFFGLKCSYRQFWERESAAFVFILYTCNDSVSRPGIKDKHIQSN